MICDKCKDTGKVIVVTPVDDSPGVNLHQDIQWEMPCDCQDRAPVVLDTYGQRYLKHFEFCHVGCSGFGARGEVREVTHCPVGLGLQKLDEVFAQGQQCELALLERFEMFVKDDAQVNNINRPGILYALNLLELLKDDKKRGLVL